MAYQHGITVEHAPFSIPMAQQSESVVQVAFGTAPINLAENPSAVVNEPVLITNFNQARRVLGYSGDYEKFSLCQVMDASLKHIGVGPVVFVNVLDPNEHKTSDNGSVEIRDGEGVIDKEGILLDSVSLSTGNGEDRQEFTKGEDYFLSFNDVGHVVVGALNGSMNGEVRASYDKLDPSKVTIDDIIGGYESDTDRYTGIETVSLVFSKLSVVPGTLIAPNYSHKQEVGHVLEAKSKKINGAFNADVILDIEGNTEEEAKANKEENGYTSGVSAVVWPKVKIQGKTFFFSAVMAARMAKLDADNDDVPYKSPSNQRIPIESAVNDDGREIFIDQVRGNRLNEKGIVTAVNFQGWRIWGNITAAFDSELEEIDIKDRFISSRRMFNWWGNTFILNYFNKVDNPLNFRLIESFVDAENIRANGFQAAGQIAGASTDFNREDNPNDQILGGKIKFVQKIGFFSPAEHIHNTIEFDPNSVVDNLFGGEQ